MRLGEKEKLAKRLCTGYVFTQNRKQILYGSSFANPTKTQRMFQDLDSPWFTINDHGLAWLTMVYHGLAWITIFDHGLA